MLSDYIDTEIESLLSCIDLSLDKLTLQKRLAMREAMLSTMKKSFDNGERAVLAKASQQVQGNTDLAIQDKRYALGVIAGWNAGSEAGYWQGRVDVARGYDSYPKPSDSILRSAQEMIKSASQAIKEMPAPKQEPVAVMGNNGRTQAKWEFADVDSFLKCCRNNTPLYDHPAPPQAAAIPEGWTLTKSENVHVLKDRS